MPTVPRIDFAPFFGLIAVELVRLKVVVDVARIVPVAVSPEEVPHFTADRDILLWPQGETSYQDSATGGGEDDTRAYATLYVVARSRLEMDEAGSDRRRLIDQSLGHYGFRQQIRGALQLFWPEAGKDAYGVQPMRWVRTQAPKQERANKDWVYSIIEFEILYPVDLSR